MKLAQLGILASLILATSFSYAQHAPICDNQCGPDPGSTSYLTNIGSRPRLHNARGRSNRRAPHVPISSSSTLHMPNLIGMAEAVPGSQSYNWSQPLVSLPGRAGLDVNLILHYNSRVWDVNIDAATVTFNIDRDFPSYGFRLDYGYLENDTTDSFWILTESDGGKHQLNLRSSSTTMWDSTDSTYIQLDTSTPANPVITYANGLQIKYEKFASQGSAPTLFRPIQITDTNGNYISIAYVSVSPADIISDQQISAITDTLGRVLTFNYNSSGQLTSITQGSFTHATFTWSTTNLTYNFSGLAVSADTPPAGTSLNVLTRCTLPNGTHYDFVYGDWGIAKEVDYYSSSSALRSYEKYNFPTTATALSDVPGYSQQTISPDGTTTYLWTYNTTKSGDIVSAQSITDPAGTVTTLNLLPSSDNCAGAVSSTTVAYGGTTLRSVSNTWQQDTASHCQLTKVVTTLNDSGQVSESDFTYDSNGNITDQKDYDFGSGTTGSLLREVITNYVAPTSNHIINLVHNIQVKDGGGALKSNTDFAYDTTTLTTLTGVAHNNDVGSAPRGNLTSITRYPTATSTTGTITRNFSYDSAGNLVRADLDCCNQKTWTYTSTYQFAYPESVTRGSTTTLTTSATYNFDTGAIATATDENNQTTSFSYYTDRRPYQTTLPNNTVLTTSYDDAAAQPSVTSSNSINSLVQVSTLDGLGRGVKQQAKNGSTVISTVDTVYDGLGRVTTVSNPYGPGETPNYTTTTYDHLNRPVQVSPPSNGFYQYDYSGNATTTTDPANKQIRRFADALARLIEVDEPAYGSLPGKGSVTISGAERSKTSFSPPPKCVPRLPCDQTGDPTVTTSYDQGTVSATINGMQYSVNYGQGDTSATIAANLASAINSDPARLVNASVSSSTVNLVAIATGVGTNYSLSVSSATTSGGFAAGTTSFPITASGTALTGGSDPAVSLKTPAVTTYGYRPTGELTQVVSGVQTRTYNYDDLGRVTSTTLPESGTWSYTYYDFGGVQTRTDVRGVITSYSYDGLNRLSGISYNVGSTGVQNPGGVIFTYGTSTASNNNGRLISMTDGIGSESYSYNTMGWATQLVKNISGTNYTIGYSYNNVGELTQITYPSGRQVGQSYDAMGRLSGITNNSAIALTINNYNAAGQVLGVTYGNGVTGAFTYNDHLRLASLSYTSGSSTLLNLTYGYGINDNGQIASITDSRGAAYSTTYTYDALSRLATAQTNDLTAANTWCLNWNYDRYGNRLAQSGCGGTLQNVFLPQLTVDPATNRINSTGYAYEPNGNMTADPNHTYKYDADDRMVGVDNGAHTYSYDANRLRVIRDSTVYVYSGTKVLAEYSGGVLQKEYLYSGARLLATILGTLTTYHHPDHLSNRVETDSNANVARTFGSLPFGDVWYETGMSDKWKFTSYMRDSETLLDYAINRYESSGLGRFSSPDRLAGDAFDPQSLNRYAYVRNDPINMVDPTGKVMRGAESRCWLNDIGNWGGCVGGGGGFVDGQYVSFGVDLLLEGGLGIQCPNNICEGQTLNNGYVKFGVNVEDGTYGYQQVLPPPSDSLYDTAAIIETQRQAVVQQLANAIPGCAQDADCVAYVDDHVQPDQNVGNGCLIGGNCNFTYDGVPIDASGCDHGRCGDFPSLHFGDQTNTMTGQIDHVVHLDTANPYSYFGIGLFVHGIVDVILGNTLLRGGIGR